MTQETTGTVRDGKLHLDCCGHECHVGPWIIFGVEIDGPVYVDGSALTRCPKCSNRVRPGNLRGSLSQRHKRERFEEASPPLF